MDPQQLSNLAQSTPTLAQLVDQMIRNVLLTVHTSMPGIVHVFNESDMTADVQPVFMYKPVGTTPRPYPLLSHVPVIFYGPAGGWLRFPVNPNDLVDLHFHERSLDSFWASNPPAPVDPGTPRIFHLTDAVAIPGLRTPAAPVTSLAPLTSMELAFAGSWLEITSAGKFKLSNGTSELLTAINQLVGALQTATSPPPDYALDPATQATLATVKTAIDALMA